MKKELHHVNKIYGNHQLARYIDVYEVSANRCHSVPESGYKGTEATLVDEPAWNEKFSSYSITGATLTGNNFILNNDVTAQANYETAKNLTLQTDGHGTIAANRNSGFIGDQVILSNTANFGYEFSNYSITGANLTGNKFNFIGNNVTAKANYTQLDPENPYKLPKWTFRLKLKNGVTPTFSTSDGNILSRTQLSSNPNVWDITLGTDGTINPNYRRVYNLFHNFEGSILEVIGANTTKIWDMEQLFADCTALTSVCLFDTSTVGNFQFMFAGCTGIKHAIPAYRVGGNLWTGHDYTNCDYMFSGCSAISGGIYSMYQRLLASNPHSYSRAFRYCGKSSPAGSAELAQIPSNWK